MTNSWNRTKLKIEEKGLEQEEESEDEIEMIDVHEYYDIEPDRLIKVHVHPTNDVMYIESDDFDELLSTQKNELPFFIRTFDETGKLVSTIKIEDLIAFLFD
jgi:hypothetical protein